MNYQLDIHGEMLMEQYHERILDVLNGYQPGNMTIAKKLFEQAQKLSFE